MSAKVAINNGLQNSFSILI